MVFPFSVEMLSECAVGTLNSKTQGLQWKGQFIPMSGYSVVVNAEHSAMAFEALSLSCGFDPSKLI